MRGPWGSGPHPNPRGVDGRRRRTSVELYERALTAGEIARRARIK